MADNTWSNTLTRLLLVMHELYIYVAASFLFAKELFRCVPCMVIWLEHFQPFCHQPQNSCYLKHEVFNLDQNLDWVCVNAVNLKIWIQILQSTFYMWATLIETVGVNRAGSSNEPYFVLERFKDSFHGWDVSFVRRLSFFSHTSAYSARNSAAFEHREGPSIVQICCDLQLLAMSQSFAEKWSLAQW